MKQEPKCVRLECQGQEDQCLPLPMGQARTALPSWTPGAGCAEGLVCPVPWDHGSLAPLLQGVLTAPGPCLESMWVLVICGASWAVCVCV